MVRYKNPPAFIYSSGIKAWGFQFIHYFLIFWHINTQFIETFIYHTSERGEILFIQINECIYIEWVQTEDIPGIWTIMHMKPADWNRRWARDIACRCILLLGIRKALNYFHPLVTIQPQATLNWFTLKHKTPRSDIVCSNEQLLYTLGMADPWATTYHCGRLLKSGIVGMWKTSRIL